uniref:LIM domain 7a n=1 Tax=Sphaeramia orbicularis TaxID=375764 RepID=A0A673CWY2_9TELE
MEWREQSTVSCDEAYLEAQRWIEAVTKKKFGSSDFRSALENGVLLCDLINKIKPGIIKRVNRLPTPIAGLDNLNVFLRACGKLGLKEAQLFHPGDLQDLSTRVTVKHQETNRRLKNVLITLYWLGRRAQCDPFYDGPYLNFKAFEGLLGTALYKALQESSSQKGSNVRDSGFGDSWYSEREELHHLRGGGGGEGGGGGHRRDDSLDSLDSLGSRPHSISSDTTLKGSSEGCCSDTEADSVFRMAENRDTSYRRSVVITPKSTTQFNQFLPTKDKSSGYVPAPLRKKRAERNEDSRRSWANPMYTEDDAPLTRSKSTSDIQVDPAVIRQNRYEELQKYREHIKQNEDKWQDDLSKWKTRRRSVNSDIVKKKEERDKIEQITYSSNRRSKTFKEMQEDREHRGRSSIGSRIGSLSFLDDDEDVFQKPATSPTIRTFPSRSYTIDTPYNSSYVSEPSLKEDEPPAASPATVSEQTSTVKTEETSTTASSLNSIQKAPEPKGPLSGTQTVVETPPSGSLYKQPQLSSMEPKPPVVSRVSASLPRSYQRSDSARLTSVVTPRPFGTQPSRISSLPRAVTMDDSQKRVNGDLDTSKKSSVPSRYHQFMTSEDEAQSQSIVVDLSSPVFGFQENYCEMRISLNQKPNSSRDFGFQAAWDSTGARVTSIQPGSPAEMCQLQIGDEVLTVNRHQVADMSYTDWKNRMGEALQEGSLVMDIRRHGKNNWDRDQPSLPFKRHKTINLTSTDHPILLGPADTNTVSSNLDFTSCFSTETIPAKEAATHPLIVSHPGPLKSSEFFCLLQIPVPSITPSSSRWSWDPEEERKRQEKWQKEQERLLQVYKGTLLHHSVSPHSPLSPKSQPTPPLWEEEERNRKEEQERQRQAEERRKREEEERELQRLQEERKRREKQEEEERKKREEEELRWQRREEEREEERRRQEAAEQQRRDRERALEQQQWSVQDLLLLFLTGGGGLGERKGQQSVSQAELERQQILNEMKKKTPLLTDSSWIRQRSTNTITSKEADIPPMRRGESLDNLDSSYNSWRSSWTPRSSSYSQNYSRPHSALSGSTSFHGGWSGARHSSSTLPSSSSMGSLSVSGKKICTFCDTPLGKGAAMIIESLGLCYHLSCFKCIDCKSDLGGSEAGAEVRIRNKQLYCNSCYMRFKSEYDQAFHTAKI